MRVFSRIALVVLALFAVLPSAFADHLLADCPLTLTATNPPATDFNLSPHGIFRFGNQVFALRGQTLTTFLVTDLGDMQIAREDFIGNLGARETDGGVTFNNGFLYVSSEAGLEIYDLRNVRVGGTAPLLVSRTPHLHYHRLTINGPTLAGLFPTLDMPCSPNLVNYCTTQIDLINVANPAAPFVMTSLSSIPYLGINDISFNYGWLFFTTPIGTFGLDVTNPMNPVRVATLPSPGTFFVTNNTDALGIGNEQSVEFHTVFSTVTSQGVITQFPVLLYFIPALTGEHSNPIMFHPQGYFDDPGGRVIMMIDEKDPQTLKPARTFAFDVFDFTVQGFEGVDPRTYEQISYTRVDEVKYNPILVGTSVFVVGVASGVQTYGACGQMTGKIELDLTAALNCGGAEIHGWVTGAQKIANVELFMDGSSLGSATLGGPPRTDVPAKTPVENWRINVNLDNTTKGVHLLTAIGTDSFLNRRQFASQQLLFNGPGLNCTNRKRSTR